MKIVTYGAADQFVCKPYCIYVINQLARIKFKRKCMGTWLLWKSLSAKVDHCICAICYDATATPNNRCNWIGKTNFPLRLSFFDFYSALAAQFLQRESMPKSPLINNIDLILFYYFVSLSKFWVFPPDFQLTSTGINREWATISPQLSESILQSKQWSFNN